MIPLWLKKIFWPNKDYNYTIKVFNKNDKELQSLRTRINEGCVQHNGRHGTMIYVTPNSAHQPRVYIKDEDDIYDHFDYGTDYDENRHMDDILGE